ncbi:MAG: glutamate synthase [Streptosporangiales bacterium]|nr:glutamate synthase [Streptosporangiales bacterium]
MGEVSVSDAVTLDCGELSTREINRELGSLPDGTTARIVEPWGRHNLAVGLANRIDIRIAGGAGYFIGGLGDGPDITVDGFVGWSVAENLMSGTVRVRGNASECAGASSHGGLLVIEGDASSRAGISLKGGTIVVAGDVGHMSGFMAQAGTMLVGGDAGHALGDSLYETVIYVAGKVASLGSDARIEEMTEADVAVVEELVKGAGFDHIDPQNVTRVASAKQLYNFDALKGQSY